jgi:hypothetical protein
MPVKRWRRAKSAATLGWEAMEITALRKLAIVPADSEEGSEGPVVAAIDEHVPGFDLLGVGDGSTERPRSRT